MRETTYTGAYGIIRKNDRQALVLKSRGPYTGLWDLPGGQVMLGGDPEKILSEVIQNLTGLKLASYEPIGVYHDKLIHNKSVDGQMEEFFHVGILFESTIKPKSSLKELYTPETLGAKWVTFEEANRLPMTFFARKSLSMWKTY